MKKQRGFTLIEMLIVVVIIAVLAALTVPRFLSQPEKAVIAEANQMLGAITRAQNNYVDGGYGTAWIALNASTDSTAWIRIGMSAPGTSNFTYSCTTAICTATRGTGGAAYSGADITVTSANPAVWNCAAGAGASRSYASQSTGGCTLGA